MLAEVVPLATAPEIGPEMRPASLVEKPRGASKRAARRTTQPPAAQ